MPVQQQPVWFHLQEEYIHGRQQVRLAGMIIGDVTYFMKLVVIAKKKVRSIFSPLQTAREFGPFESTSEVSPSQFIFGDDGNDLDHDAQVCTLPW